MAGRPTKLTKEVHARIVKMIGAGVPPETAAGACGVARATFYEWMSRARGTHRLRATRALEAFAVDVERALAQSEARLALKLAEYIDGTRPAKRDASRRVRSRLSYQQILAAQWALARRFPARWGGGTAASLTTQSAEDDVGPPKIVITLAPLDDEEAEQQLPSLSGGWRD